MYISNSKGAWDGCIHHKGVDFIHTDKTPNTVFMLTPMPMILGHKWPTVGRTSLGGWSEYLVCWLLLIRCWRFLCFSRWSACTGEAPGIWLATMYFRGGNPSATSCTHLLDSVLSSIISCCLCSTNIWTPTRRSVLHDSLGSAHPSIVFQMILWWM